MNQFELSLCPRWKALDPQEEWAAFTGQSRREYGGWGWLNAVHPADRTAVVRESGRARATGTPHDLRYRVRRGEGGFHQVETRALPVVTPGGRTIPEGWDLLHRPTEPVRSLPAEHSFFDWRAIADQLQDGIITTNAEGRITFVNPQARKLHGVEKLGVGPDAYADHYRLFTLDGDPYPSERLPLARAVRSGEVVKDAVWVIRRADGTSRVVQGDAGPIRDEKGRQVGSLLTCRDITDEYRARARREREHQVFEQVFRDSPVFKALLTGPDHRVDRANPACRRLVGDRRLVGLPVDEAFSELADESVLGILDKVRASGDAHRADAVRVVVGDAESEAPDEWYLDACYTPLVNAEGEVWAILATWLDVTTQVRERHEQERLREMVEQSTVELRERDERFTEIAETLDGVIWTTSPDRTEIEYLSPAYERIWGRPRSEAYDDAGAWLDSVHPDDRSRMEDVPAIQRQGAWEGRYRIVRPDGEIRWIRTRSSPALDATGSVRRIVGVSQDVTEQVRMQEVLERSERMNALGSMAGRVAHDFNNIITSIVGLAELTRHELPPGSTARDDVTAIIDNGKRAAALTAQLTAFSRNEDRAPSRVDVRTHLEGLERMIEVLLGREHALTLDVADEEAVVECLPSEIDQVVTNLAANARDAMASAPGRLHVETRVIELPGERPLGLRDASPLDDGRYVHLRVADTGVGMEPETVERIFEPFFTTKERNEGTGLGLSTVFGIVTARGGRIWVESEPAVGTTFHVLLPLVSGQDRSGPETTEPDQPTAFEGGTILVVDDDDQLRRIITRFFESKDCTVLSAASAEAALDLIGESPGRVKLVVSDVGLPGIGVRELLARLRSRLGPVPVLLISGSGREELEDRGISSETPFLPKPFGLAALQEAVTRVIGDSAPCDDAPGRR